MGCNDAPWLGAGWHPAHIGPGGVVCRWMAPVAEVRPPDDPKHIGLIIVTVSPPDATALPPGLSIYRGKTLLAHASNLGSVGQWTAILLDPDPAESTRPIEQFTLVVEHLNGTRATPLGFVPHAVSGNGDFRELGLLISTIRFIEKG